MPEVDTGRSHPAGTVYLLHFHAPYRHARHYTGWTSDLPERLAEHRAGRGARLLAVVQGAGITWSLARTWTGGRGRERALKRQGGASRRCPLCGIRIRPAAALLAPPVPTDRKDPTSCTRPPLMRLRRANP